MIIDRNSTARNAQKLLAAGKTQSAIDEYLKILRDSPTDWSLMMLVGELYLKVGNSTQAIKLFQKVADHHCAEGFLLKAIAIYKRINRLYPVSAETRIRLADLYFRQGLATDARFELLAAVDHYEKQGQRRETINLYIKLIEIDPEDIEVRRELARAYERETMISEAVAQYLEISGLLARKGQQADSLAALEIARRLNPRNPAVLWKMLWIFLEGNEIEKTNELLEHFSLANPAEPEILALIVKTFSHDGHPEKMMDLIDRAVKTSSRQEPLRVLKGELYLRQPDVESAFTEFVTAIEEQMAHHEYAKGIALMRRLTRTDPTFYPAWELLIDLYIQQGLESNLSSAYSSLADAYIARAMYDDAHKCLAKLLELDPRNRRHFEKLDFVRSFLEMPEAYRIDGSQFEVSQDFDLEINMSDSAEGQKEEASSVAKGDVHKNQKNKTS